MSNLRKDIAHIKSKLIAKCKRSGLYENFGQKEVRDLQDKYHYLSLVYGTPDERAQANQIDALDDWAMNYTGE